MNDEAIHIAKQWLASKGVTLWMNWDITQEDGLEAAAQWLVANLEEFSNYFKSIPKHDHSRRFDVV